VTAGPPQAQTAAGDVVNVRDRF